MNIEERYSSMESGMSKEEIMFKKYEDKIKKRAR